MKLYLKLLLTISFSLLITANSFAQSKECDAAYNENLALIYEKKPNVVMQRILNNKFDEFKTLLKCDYIDLNILFDNDVTALHIAVGYSSDVRFTQELLKAGANPNVRNKNGVSPMMYANAGDTENFEITKALLEGGEYPLWMDAEGIFAYQYASSRKFTKSAELIKKAINEMKMNNADDYKTRGRFYFLTLNDPTKGIADFNESIKLGKNEYGVFYLRALALRDTKQRDLALEDFNKAISLKDDVAFVYVHRAVCYLMLDKTAEAEKDFAQAIKLDANAEKEIPMWRKFAADNKGSAAAETKSTVTSQNANTTMVQTNSGNNLDNCYNLLKGGKNAEAVTVCTAAISEKPNDFKAYHYRGLAYFNQKNDSAYRSAVKDFRKSNELFNGDTENNYMLGYLVMLTAEKYEDYDEAIKAFSEAIRLNTTHDDVYYRRGECYRMRALPLNWDPKVRDTAKAKQYNESAIADFRKHLEKTPDEERSLLKLSMTFTELQQNDAAIETLDKLLQKYPNNKEGHYQRAGVNFNLKKYDVSLAGAKKALEVNKASSDSEADKKEFEAKVNGLIGVVQKAMAGN